jgi:hypothetical protein
MVNINYIKHKSGLLFNKNKIYRKEFFNYNAFLFVNNIKYTRMQDEKEKLRIDYLFWYDAFNCNYYISGGFGDIEDAMIWQMSRQIATEMDRRIIDTLSANVNKLLTMDKF